MNKYLLLLLFSTFLSLYAYGQQSADQAIYGSIQMEDGQPIVSVSVFLMSTSTKAIIKTAVTDDLGKYKITHVPNGNYYIEVTAIGKNNVQSDNFDFTGKTIEMATLIMTNASETIEGVTVTAQIPLVRNANGKLIMDVESSTLAAGNTALDVLRRAPGVTVDNNDNILLMGRGGINVTIDGRQTFMTGDQLATFLKSMDASQIKSIEVGTTRTASEDAEGSAGSINIILKKNNTEGFNGTFVASAAHGERERGNTSLALNYKKGNTTVFGSYSFMRNAMEFDININRIIAEGDRETEFDQSNPMNRLARTHNYRFGVEQKTSDLNTMAFQFSAYNNRDREHQDGTTRIGVPNLPVDSILSSRAFGNDGFNRYSLNFNNEFKTDTIGGKLTLDMDYSWFRNTQSRDYEYRMFRPDGTLFYTTEFERSRMPVNINIYVGKLDYLKPLSDKSRFETGVKYSSVKTDNDLQFEQFVNDQWIDFPRRPNHFIYTENIAAGYVDYNLGMEKWSVKAGLRGEWTMSDANSISGNEPPVKRDYLDFFPSVNVTHTPHENHILALSYARKITRPNYRFLNPGQLFIDKFTFQQGNPYLQPQYTHGFSLNYTLMKMFNFTLGSDITNDAITESLGQNAETNESWIIRENLGKQINSYLNMNTPARFFKFWTMNNNMTLVHMYFRGPIAGAFVDQGGFMFQLNNMSTFKISDRLSAESSIAYTSPFIYNVYRLDQRWNLDLGTSYNFKDQKSSLKLAMNDVFRTNRFNVSTNFSVFNSNIRQYYDSQVVRLTYTYKFGNLRQVNRRSDRENEERSRAQ